MKTIRFLRHAESAANAGLPTFDPGRIPLTEEQQQGLDYQEKPMNTKTAEEWRVMVSDNFDFMDEDEPASNAGTYPTYEEALARAKEIVESSVKDSQGATAEEIYDHYMSFGDDAFILAPFGAKQPEPLFSSWDYAKVFAAKVADRRPIEAGGENVSAE